MPSNLLFTVVGSKATPATPVTLAEAGLRERRDLQEWVLAHPNILGDDIAIVTFEFDRWWASAATPTDRLDILALGADGTLVVAELKKDKAPANSWSANSGQGGHFTLPYVYIVQRSLAADFWTLKALGG